MASHLKDGILAGRYAPGQRLIEADLTRDLGVSRGPLREAFRKLTAEGLIESVPNKGAVVRRLAGPGAAGVHRVAWDLRFPDPTALGAE